MIRLFQFVNTTPRVTRDPGDYVALGTFDYMTTWSEDWKEKEIQQIISDPFGYSIRKKLTKSVGEHVYIVGFYDEDEKDKDFWMKKDKPFLFISSLKLLHSTELRFLDNENVITYSTLDSGDGLVCLKTDRYSDGYQTIYGYDEMIRNNGNRVVRGSTMVLINPEGGVVQDEPLDVLLRCRVDDRDKFYEFTKALEEQIGQKIKHYGVFGYDDNILRIDGISADKWRALYVGGEPITNGEELRQYGIIDIRTEVLESSNGSETDEAREVGEDETS